MKSLMRLLFFLLCTALVFSFRFVEDGTANAKSGGALKGPDYSGLPELTVTLPLFGSKEKGELRDLGTVEAAISAITAEKLGVRVKFLQNSILDDNSLLIKMSSNQTVDILCMSDAARFHKAGYLTGLDGLLDRYGKGIMDSVDGELLGYGRFEDVQYCLPTNRDIVASWGLCMRKDILQKYNIRAENISTFDDVERVFAIVHKNEPEMICTMSKVPGMALIPRVSMIDLLGDGLGVLRDGPGEPKVENLFETEEYSRKIRSVHRWYTEGYLPPDVLDISHTSMQLMSEGILFSYWCKLKPGIDHQESLSSGCEVVSVAIIPPLKTTLNPFNCQWGISSSCERPEDAMRLLNLFYTDSEIMNLLCWGIEGEHYTVCEDGTIDYPPNIDAKTSGYSPNSNWCMPNQYIARVWKGSPPDLARQTIDFNSSAKKSRAYGFVFDNSSVKSEYSAVSRVYREFKPGLEFGVLDPEEALPALLEKLDAAGIDAVIAEKQRQLDAWLAT